MEEATQGPDHQDEVPATGDFDPIRSLTRLGLGAATFAVGRLMSNLRTWEEDVDARLSSIAPDVIVVEEASDEDEDDDEAERIGRDPEEIRLAMIGAIFDAQRRVRERAGGVGRAATHAVRGASMVLSIFGVMDAVDTAGRRLTPFLDMSDKRFRELVSLGRDEDLHSSLLVGTAFKETTEASIDPVASLAIGQLAESPEIRELIRSQSTGMAEEVIDEVRVRAADADDRAENVARSIFRRGSREPDDAVEVVIIGDGPPPA